MVNWRFPGVGAFVLLLAGCGGASGSTDTAAQPGAESGPCVDGECLGSLMCFSDVCVDAEGSATMDSGNTNPSGSGPDTSGPGTPQTAGTTGPETTGPETSGPGTTEPATTNSNSGTTADPTTGGGCEVVEVVPEKSHIAFAVDKTGSTSSVDWDHDGSPQTLPISRWNSIYNVLSEVLGDFEDEEEMALALFPAMTAKQAYDESACTVLVTAEVSMALNNADEIILNLPGPNAWNLGATAMSRGVALALTEFANTPQYAPRAVVLITDGVSNCAVDAQSNGALFEIYDETVHTLVTNAYADGIVTYVLGIEVSNSTTPIAQDGIPNNVNPSDKLNELAVQGGRPLPNATKFYQSYNEIDLKLGLQEVLEDAKSCNLVLGEPATQPMATQVKVAGKTYIYDAELDCDTDDGWTYLDDTYTAIQLCGAGCAELKDAGTASVTIGC